MTDGATPSHRVALTSRLGLRAFGYNGYATLWSANLAWNVGRWMEQLAVGWLSVELTGSPFLVAMIGFYRSLPLFLLGVFGGVLGDRFERRQLLFVLQIVSVAGVGTLAVLSSQGQLRYGHLVAVEIILGIATALDWPSRRALTVDLVGREDLQNAIALDATGMNVSRMLGPLASGILIAALNPGVSLSLLAIIYLINAGLILRLPKVPHQAVKQPSVIGSLRSGFRSAFTDEAIVGVLLITVLMNLLFYPYQQLLPVMAIEVLRTDAVGLGLLTAADGFESFIGSVIIALWVGSKHHGFYFWFGSINACLCMIGFAFSPTFGIAALLLAIGGFGRAGFGAFQSTIILRRSTTEMRGRSMGILTIAIGAGPFGQLEMGALAEAIGTPMAIFANVSACALLVGVVTTRLRGLREA